MIVDFLLGVVVGMGNWVVSILPEIPQTGTSFLDDAPGAAGASTGIMGILSVVNYWIPLEPILLMAAFTGVIYTAVILYKFVWRILPGVG
jgi:hypothetical protein